MKILKNTIVAIALSVLVLSIALFLIGYLRPPKAGIRINTVPESTVYIDGILAGETSFSSTHEPGEIAVKLVPKNTDRILQPFETKLKLTGGVETYISREFGETENLSSGTIISFDKTNSKETSLVVISTPDNVQVSIDGVPRGFSPYKSATISPASHEIGIKTPGFADLSVTIRTLEGYRLTFFAKLKKNNETAQDESKEEGVEKKVYIQILDTPTGFLRVRTSPGTTGSEIAEVKPGERYLFLEEDSESGWFKIQYAAPDAGLPSGITGWVSNEFSQKIETPL